MTKPVPTLREVLEHPSMTPHEDGIDLAAIEAYLKEDDSKRVDLVPVHFVAGIGAWVATVFFVGFFAMVGMFEHEGSTAIFGLVLLGAGIFMSRAKLIGVFVKQLDLALALTGNALIVVAAANLASNEVTAILAAHVIVCVLSYPLTRSRAYRLLAPIGVPVLAVFAMFAEETFALLHVLVGLEALLFAVLWLGKTHRRELQPLAYAAACMLPVTLLLIELAQFEIWGVIVEVRLWPSSLLLAIGLVWVYYRLAAILEAPRSPVLLLAVIGTLVLGAVATPGLLVTMGLLTIGRALSDRYLLALAYLFLPVFLYVYYYALSIDLVNKSWVIAGSGAVLLVIRQVLIRITHAEERA